MSTENLIAINVDYGETRVAVIERGMIAEFFVSRTHEKSNVGNIFKGKVTRILPGIQAAFVDIGLEKHAFLHASNLGDLDFANFSVSKLRDTSSGNDRPNNHHKPLEKRLKEGQFIPVQVSKDQIGTKGCRVTADISIAGRHLVYMPLSPRGGVSRKIEDDKERRRLGKILARLNTGGAALIARTVADGASADALDADAAYLSDVWVHTMDAYEKRKSPGVIYTDLNLPLRMARDKFNDTIAGIIVDSKTEYEALRRFIDRLAPSRYDDITLYEGEQKIFDAFGIESEIKRALERVVELPSGGSLVIDQGEALTAVDVNTGKFVGKGSKNQEDTIYRTNMEAVEEIAYQMRFRNIGGLIVLDLIDMDNANNRQQVVSKLKEALKSDRARTSVNAISRFGLVEMTRERTTESLGRMLHENCPYCDGAGNVLSRVTIANEVLRELERRSDDNDLGVLKAVVHPHVAATLKGDLASAVNALRSRIDKKIVISENKTIHMEHYHVQLTPLKSAIHGD